MNDDVEARVDRVRARVTAKTLIEDISEPPTGALDRGRIAAIFTNIETAVGDVAEAVAARDTKDRYLGFLGGLASARVVRSAVPEGVAAHG